MPSIGETLREARMRQRLDIADVEERTKIRAKYLRALENEEFASLPGTTFARTFLRTYAEVLGLDPHVLVEEYRTNFEQEEELETQTFGTPGAPPPPPRDRERRYTGGPPSRLTVVIGAVVLLVAFLLILGLTGGEDKGDDQASKTSSKTETARRPAKKKPRPKAPAPAPSQVALRVTPTVPTYVCLDTGPGTEIIYQGILSEARDFKEKKLRINLGKTSVELQLNGKKFPVEQAATPVGYEFSTKGNKQLEAGQRPCA